MSESFEVVSRVDIGRSRWNDFVNSSSEAWLWHLYELQDTLCTWPGREDISFVVIDKSSAGRIIGILPLHLIKGNARRILNLNHLDSFGGLATIDDLGEKHKKKVWRFVTDKLNSLAEIYKVIDIKMLLAPMTPSYIGENCPRVNPLLQYGWTNSLTQTWVIDLRRNEADLWNNLQGRARTAVKKAMSNGVEVRQASGREDLKIYYKLHCETYNRTGVTPHPFKYFAGIWDNFVEKGFANIFFAEYEGEVVTAENFGIFKKATVYWTGASSNKGLSVEANSLLQWHAIKYFAEQGIEWYETGEAFPHLANGKLKGLNDFKESFGGVLYPCYKGDLDTSTKAQKLLKFLGGFYNELKS